LHNTLETPQLGVMTQENAFKWW